MFAEKQTDEKNSLVKLILNQSLVFLVLYPDKICYITETFEKRQANTLFWSPNGQFIVVAGLRR